MKQLFIIPLLAFLSFCAQSQDYSPVRVNYTYQYLSDSIVHSFKTARVLNDTLYFNRLMKPINSDTYKIDSNNVLGTKMYQTVNGFAFVHTRKDTVHIKTDGTESWLFQKTGNVTASYVGKTKESFLGITDSVMNIHLSNGKKLMISKDYGLIKAYRFFGLGQDSLVIDAIPEAKLGTPVNSPFTYWGKYEVGDVLGTYSGYSYPSALMTYKIRRIEIVKKYFSVNSDTLIYDVNIIDGNVLAANSSGGPRYSTFPVNYISLSQSKIYIYNGFRKSQMLLLNEFGPAQNYSENEKFDGFNNLDYPSFNRVVYTSTNQVKSKGINYVITNQGVYSCKTRLNPSPNCDSSQYRLMSNDFDQERFVMQERIGLKQYAWIGFESKYYAGTNCYTLNGVTYGDCSVYDMLVTSIDDKTIEANQVKAYPNPAKDVLQFTNADKIERLTFVNSIGSESVFQVTGESLNISSLQAGLYILKMQLKNGGIVNQKLVID